MRIVVVAVGRLKSGPERDLAERYRERADALGRGLGVTGPLLVEKPESRARRAADRMAEEAQAIRSALPGPFIAFDERGTAPTSTEFAARIRAGLDGGMSTFALAIGGPDGLDPALRRDASAILSFGAMTLPHGLVRVLVAEQIYRALTILAGHPYHRAGSEER